MEGFGRHRNQPGKVFWRGLGHGAGDGRDIRNTGHDGREDFSLLPNDGRTHLYVGRSGKGPGRHVECDGPGGSEEGPPVDTLQEGRKYDAQGACGTRPSIAAVPLLLPDDIHRAVICRPGRNKRSAAHYQLSGRGAERCSFSKHQRLHLRWGRFLSWRGRGQIVLP